MLLIGEAGIGKSRLAQQLHVELAETPHTWMETGGSPYFANPPPFTRSPSCSSRASRGLRTCALGKRTSPPWRRGDWALRLRLGERAPGRALPLVTSRCSISRCPRANRPVVRGPRRWSARACWRRWLLAWVFGMARLQPLVLLVEDLRWVDPSTLEVF